MRPLEGVRIVECAQMISAPFATSILSDQGAEVIKVEAADGVGDRMRYLGDRRGGLATVFHGLNRGKKSVALNAKDPRGLEALTRLIDSADVYVQNFRPGVAERLGIGPEAMRARNPALVAVSVSGFGPSGPYVDQMVYDFVIQGVIGLAVREGSEERPRLSRHYVIDKATALTSAQAISVALFQRERTGVGQHIEIDMLAAGLQFFWPDGMADHTLLGDGIERVTHQSASYDVRRTKDQFISLNLASKSTWPRLVEALDSDELRNDPRFADYDSRQAHAAELNDAVEAVLSTLTADELLERMVTHDIPGGRVLGFDDVHHDPQVIHNQVLVEIDSGPIGPRREARPAARFGAEDTPIPEPAPLLGADTDAVLADLGYSDADLADFARQGVTRPPSSEPV